MFTKADKSYCLSRLEQHFDNLNEAQSSCLSNDNCGGVYDPDCRVLNVLRHQNEFGLCDKNSGKRYSSTACVYYKL